MIKLLELNDLLLAKGDYKRSSKSNVKGARKKGATLRDWFEKENWINVATGERLVVLQVVKLNVKRKSDGY